LAAIAACGHTTIIVSRKPRVAILPTGTELVPVGKPARRGEIIEFNSIMIAAQVMDWGGIPVRYPITEDKFEKLLNVVEQAAAENDLVLINAGSSAGEEDFTAEVVEKLGRLLVHGVAVRPGHPVIIGIIEKGNVPVIGVPGYPVSAALTGEIFLEPLLATWTGRKHIERTVLSAEITRKVTSPAGDDDYLRVAVGMVGDRYLAAPLSRGAGVISSLVQADGVVVLPAGVQGLPAGTSVNVRLYTPVHEIERTIFAIGSHDMSLDILAQMLAKYDRRLVSANTGSFAGLIALQRGEAHIAGSHLLDPDTGEYNRSYIRKYLPGRSVHLITLVERSQGLMTTAGNPKGIRTLKDLRREDVSYVNRQRAAGTRVLLDYHLQKLGITAREIKGYEHEEYTHLAVAAAVASGRADCGLGIAAAADALGLNFIPLYSERYDLVIPTEYYQDALLHPIISLLKDPEFKKSVAEMPGYGVERMGEIVEIIEP
jgi:putative molybdopterin biosynthesis protein